MSVFSRIRSVFRAKGFPDENFLTEIVFGFIERYPEKFIAWLRIIEATRLPVECNLSAATQYHSAESIEDKLPAKRPDMLIWLHADKKQQVIFIESKVGSSLSGDDQLHEYMRILSKLPTNASRTLLFVTRDYAPQDRAQLFKGINDAEEPEFVQARWHEFSSFLMKQSDLVDDTLVAELLDYMKERQLDIPNTFTPLDIASLTGFSHALAVMRAVLDGELAQEFERSLGSIIDQYDRDNRVARSGVYVHRMAPGKQRGAGVSLGFSFRGEGGDYPLLYGAIWFDSKTQNKTAVIDALRRCAAESNGRWADDNLVPTASFGRIHHSVSVGQFLGADDHVDAMRRYLSDVLKEITEFRKKYPELAERS